MKWILRIGSLLAGCFVSGAGYSLRHGSLSQFGAAGSLLGLILLYGGIAFILWTWFGWERTKVDLGGVKRDWELEP